MWSIGVVETHGRKGIAELVPQLEVVPRKKIEYKGTLFEEMDVDAIIARSPAVVLVDELAHTNIPGSKHRKRYEDVLELLNAKIDVLSTVNIQHIESIAPTVNAITGVVVRETVPDWVLRLSEETVMVDLTPEALQNRMKRGDVYHTRKGGAGAEELFPPRQPDRAARARAAASGRAGGPQPFVLHGGEGYSGDLGGARTDRRRVSARIRARNICWRGPRAWRAGWTRSSTPCTSISARAWTRRDEKSLAANLQFAESLGAKAVRLKGDERSRCRRAIRARKARHADDLRPDRHRGMAKASLHERHQPLPARRPRRGRPHRHPGTRLILKSHGS